MSAPSIRHIEVLLPSAVTGQPQVWTGSAWAKKPVKVWTGAAWVVKPMKRYTGSTWVAV